MVPGLTAGWSGVRIFDCYLRIRFEAPARYNKDQGTGIAQLCHQTKSRTCVSHSTTEQRLSHLFVQHTASFACNHARKRITTAIRSITAGDFKDDPNSLWKVSGAHAGGPCPAGSPVRPQSAREDTDSLF
eukprot:518470-Rhodomonas_salina.2